MVARIAVEVVRAVGALGPDVVATGSRNVVFIAKLHVVGFFVPDDVRAVHRGSGRVGHEVLDRGHGLGPHLAPGCDLHTVRGADVRTAKRVLERLIVDQPEHKAHERRVDRVLGAGRQSDFL